MKPVNKGLQRRIVLTARETEVLRLIASGNANKTIAAVLGIGIKTVGKHREHLMEKLDIHETAGLTRYAIATGIIENHPISAAAPADRAVRFREKDPTRPRMG